MKINVEIDKNVIRWHWKAGLRYVRRPGFIIKYDINVNQTPKHIANYMAGILLSEVFAWNDISIEFNELTQEELFSINDLIRANYYGNPYKRVIAEKCPIARANKIVKPYKFKNDGPIICANGMGKDGLLTAMLVKELGYDLACFTSDGQYRASIWKERVKTANEFYKQEKIKSHWLHTTLLKNIGYKVISRIAMALPLAIYYNSSNMLKSFNIGDSVINVKTKLPVRPLIGVFSNNNISKTLGINVGCPSDSISLAGTEKLLIERYSQIIKYQRSCMPGNSWCGKCGKCYGVSLITKTVGYNPQNYGFPELKLHTSSKPLLKKGNPLGAPTYAECERKLRGEPYKNWIEKSNICALKMSWGFPKLKDIFEQHFQFYDIDPGPDECGATLIPSKWDYLLGRGFNEFWRRI